ncbi:DUF4838 domain-containing protein [Paraburkholderia sp. BCC1886]|uniref:DUF4838 domain-containing protein n=1 Tax=Paraburkholderia sp. BCC1886 TaxID=2562670 RepID=UPI00118240F9|nr:DUF4838 domain-containing protein [Paraburkholderia sp. BCC1886]
MKLAEVFDCGRLVSWVKGHWPGVSLSLLLLAVSFNACAALVPAIVNGDFSRGHSGWWGDKFEIVPTENGRALQLSSGFAAQDKIAIEPAQHYLIQVSIRAVDAPPEAVFVQTSFRGGNVDKRWRGSDQVHQKWGTEAALFVARGPDGKWGNYRAVLAAPEQADQLLIYLRKQPGSSGVAEFRNLSVTPTEEPETSAGDLQGARLRTTLLAPALPEGIRIAQLNALVEMGRPPSKQLLLADRGIAKYHIYVGSSADAMTLHAAGELSDYFKQISGADFGPLSSDAAPGNRPVIIVGNRNQLAPEMCPDSQLATLGEDGFVFCTRGKNLVIEGSTSRGTMYGVNWFLDHVLGVRWLAPDATYIPSHPTLTTAPLNERHTPRFAYREILSSEGQDRAFRAHNLLNGESHGPSFSSSPAVLDSWDHSWLAKGGDASFWELLPQALYAKTHPEWYAGGQLAMMNPDVRRIIAENIVTRLRRLPDYRLVWFGIHDMDWGWDMDPASRAFADKHGGSPSAPLLDMISDVAMQVRQVMPGARFAFNAYHWGFTPPSGMSVPDYVLVYPMTIQVDYSSPLNVGRNEALGKGLTGWNAIASHMFVWDHITNFGGFIQPTPNIYPIGESIQWLATLDHVSGYFAEGSWNTSGAEFASLRVWMMARLLWDPNQNVHNLVAEYCENYFGPAAPYVLRYIDLMHAALAQSGDMLREQTPIGMKMYSPTFVASVDQLLAQAEQHVSGNEVLTARVRQARLPLDYVILVRRNEYVAAPHDGAWELDLDNRLGRFNDSVKKARLTMFRQGAGLPALAELLAIERHTPTPPDGVADIAPADWKDFQDLDLTVFGGAHIVADSLASDGAAVQMKGDSSVWALQFKFDKLPPGKSWDLYVALRVRQGKTALRRGGVRVGSFPPMDLSTRVSLEDVTGDQYRIVKVPGGPFSYGTNHEQGAYVQADRLNPDDQLMVDRIFAVRHGTAVR